MKKGEIFKFTAPNGAVVQAIILKIYDQKITENFIGRQNCIAYAQNRIFTCKVTFKRKYPCGCVPNGKINSIVVDKVSDIDIIVEYAVIQEYDALLDKQ